MSLNTIDEVEGEGEGARQEYSQAQRPGYASHSTPVQKNAQSPTSKEKRSGRQGDLYRITFSIDMNVSVFSV